MERDVNDRFDDDSPSSEDADVLERLRAALGADPLPAGVTDRAEGLLAFRDVDRELLELLHGADEPAGLRGGPGTPGRLVFELRGGAVSVEVLLERGVLHGQVLAGSVTEVGLERPGGGPQTVAVDPLGRFSFADPASGPTRLRLHGGGARPMRTDWFAL
jgi:hypothetical protein